MKNKSRKIIITSLLLIGLLLSASNSIAKPVIGNIQLEPTIPKPQDEITFTADIIENYDFTKAVYLVVDEYKDDTLYSDGFNKSMFDYGDGSFDLKIQLKYEDTTKIKYHFVINIKDYIFDWTESEVIELNLDTSMTRASDPDTNNDDDDGSDGTSGTPGFELILVFCALAFILFLRRKRQ